MKGTHLYERMSNPNVVKTYIHMINNNEIELVKALIGNLSMEADDHPRFPAIVEAYTNRLIREENNKE